MICKRCLIDGLVQGVFFRAATREQAIRSGVTGWVRNLADGRVESVVQGEQAQVDEMLQWFWQGSPPSRVNSVQCYDEPVGDFQAFTITR